MTDFKSIKFKDVTPTGTRISGNTYSVSKVGNKKTANFYLLPNQKIQVGDVVRIGYVEAHGKIYFKILKDSDGVKVTKTSGSKIGIQISDAEAKKLPIMKRKRLEIVSQFPAGIIFELHV